MTPDDYQFMNDTLIQQAGEMEIQLQAKDECIRDLEAELSESADLILNALEESWQCPWCGKRIEYNKIKDHYLDCKYYLWLSKMDKFLSSHRPTRGDAK